MGVANLVIEHGGNGDQAIVALLHDAVEDQGGKPRLGQVREEFGGAVAQIASDSRSISLGCFTGLPVDVLLHN
jgi:(p)ppGpp synthase/HD superfamily hydrolase